MFGLSLEVRNPELEDSAGLYLEIVSGCLCFFHHQEALIVLKSEFIFNNQPKTYYLFTHVPCFFVLTCNVTIVHSKNAGLNTTQCWVNIGQNTCWVVFNQQLG